MSAEALTERVRAELAALSYPTTPWVERRSDRAGRPVHACAVIGAGQSGLAITAGLRRRGIDDVVLLDAAPMGEAGVWRRFARMAELRTPKALNGIEFGCPSLSVGAWLAATQGPEAWDALERIPREAWADYLLWYAETLGLSAQSGLTVRDIRPAEADENALAVMTESDEGRSCLKARTVVIATGMEALGGWRVPDFIRDSLPSERYDHTNQPLDFAKLRGLRVAVLGHGASAFDNAAAALAAGAARVDLCFRRDRLPRVNPHRHLDDAGTMAHFPDLDDATRWAVARHMRRVDQPPPQRALNAALAMPGFHLHPGRPWLAVKCIEDCIEIATPKGPLRCDHLLCATGVAIDPAARPELTSLAPAMARWADCFTPPPGAADDRLSAYPYLATDFSFLPRHDSDLWVTRAFAFNGSSAVSHGPHATSISGHRYALPRVIDGVARRLFTDQASSFLARLEDYAQPELDLAADFEDLWSAPPAVASRPIP
jgi:cation diffusion facilitator CzcD-associated flavoprotein CzcO